MRFIDTLPDMEGKFAVPFVTWGAACSGIALWQMARALTSKGCRIAGAAKVCGEHSLTFQRDEPVGKGRPSAEDDRVVRELAHKVMDDYLHGDGAGLPLESLDYQPAERADEMKRKLVEPPPLIGRSVDEAACTQCGICVDNCPVEAVQLTPFPEFGSRCFDCFTCMKTCPEDAIKPAIPLDKIVSMIEKRVETIGERPLTHVFV
jgi:ferredoxin